MLHYNVCNKIHGGELSVAFYPNFPSPVSRITAKGNTIFVDFDPLNEEVKERMPKLENVMPYVDLGNLLRYIALNSSQNPVEFLQQEINTINSWDSETYENEKKECLNYDFEKIIEEEDR
jgi:hypothetical protein